MTPLGDFSIIPWVLYICQIMTVFYALELESRQSKGDSLLFYSFPGFHLYPHFWHTFMIVPEPTKPVVNEYPFCVVVMFVEPHFGQWILSFLILKQSCIFHIPQMKFNRRWKFRYERFHKIRKYYKTKSKHNKHPH